MIATLAAGASHTTVNHSMRRDFPAADANESLEPALNRMSQSQFETVPVLDNGKLVALLTRENVAEYVMIHSALYASNNSRYAEPKPEEIAA
jgi:predicted transcriptional regulator